NVASGLVPEEIVIAVGWIQANLFLQDIEEIPDPSAGVIPLGRSAGNCKSRAELEVVSAVRVHAAEHHDHRGLGYRRKDHPGGRESQVLAQKRRLFRELTTPSDVSGQVEEHPCLEGPGGPEDRAGRIGRNTLPGYEEFVLRERAVCAKLTGQ